MSDFQRQLVNVLRGRSTTSVTVGRLHFYHFWQHYPRRGVINVPWVKDLRSKQLAMHGYDPEQLIRAYQYLTEDRVRFAPCNAFVCPTELFAQEVCKWYGEDRPFGLFANYPDQIADLPLKNDREIVYIDYSSTVFQPEFYRRLFILFDDLAGLVGMRGVVAATHLHKDISQLPHSRNITIIPLKQYKHTAQYGALVNLDGFAQAAECLPRKLLFYLHCGMIPLIHGTFYESIRYCRRNGIDPLVYYEAADIATALPHYSADFDRERFSINYRIPELVSYLKHIGGI